MFKSLLDFGYKRNKLQALGFCIVFFAVGVAIAIAMGALEYFLFSGHKFRHVITGGQFIVLIEIWIVSYLIINAKHLYKNPVAILLMSLATVLCFFASIISWLLIGILTTLSPLPQAQKNNNRIAAILFRSVVILIPLGFLVYDFMFIGVIPAIGIETARTVSYMIKHPEAVQRRDEIASAVNAYSKVRFNKSKETADKGYKFAITLAKYNRYYDAMNVLGEIPVQFLNAKEQNIVKQLKDKIQQILDRPNLMLITWAGEIDRGYSYENDTSGMYAVKAGDYRSAAESYQRSFETIGGNNMMTGFDLVEVFKNLKQYKNAIYVIDQILEEHLTNEYGTNKLESKKQELISLGLGSAEDGKYWERYEKFKTYRTKYRAVRKLDPSKNPPDEIIAELLRTIEIAPTIVDVVRTRAYLAHIYVEAGQYDKALGEIGWLRQNLAKVNGRLLKDLDGYEWMINRKKAGTENSPDPVQVEIKQLISQ